MASESVSTGFQTILTGTSEDGVELLGDLLRLRGDLLEDVLAVEVLAAGEEPDFVAARGRCCWRGWS